MFVSDKLSVEETRKKTEGRSWRYTWEIKPYLQENVPESHVV